MRSPIFTASSMSWVTNTIVLRTVVLEPQELVLQPRPGDGVDGAERLVHEQHGRVGGQRARDADALALPARQLGRVPAAVRRRVEADQLEQLVDAGRDASAIPAEQAGHGPDVRAMVWCGNRPTCWIT